MGVSYTSALERDTRRRSKAAGRVGTGDLLLVVTSFAAVFAIWLAHAGRDRTFEMFEHRRGSTQVIDLTAVTDAAQLEPPLEPLFANVSDRRFAARELLHFVLAEREAGRTLPNVGVVLRSAVPVETIARATGLVAYKERLRIARENAVAGRGDPPRSLPLFTSADLTVLKWSFAVRSRNTFRQTVLLCVVLYIAGFHILALFWHIRGVRGDHVMLAAAHLLTALGFAVLLSRADPLRDTLLVVRYTEGILTGLAVMAAISVIDFRTAAFLKLSYLPLIGALLLSGLLIVFGDGPGSSHAKVNLGPVQPIEAIRLLMTLFLAGYFARRWDLLRQIRSEMVRDFRVPTWLNMPRAEYVLPVLLGVAAALTFFFLQKDLGPALLVACVFLSMYALARRRIGMAAGGFGLLVAGFYVGYRLHISETLAARVRMWQSPWDNAVSGGDQIAQAMWALATGGPFGTGLGLGDTRYLPAGHTDLVVAAVGEEVGVIGLLVVAGLYGLLAWRGFAVARTARSDYGFFLASGMTLFLVVPVLVMGAAVLGLVPLTGVVTPFLSYGGSAMTANFAALGVLAAIDADPHPRADLEPFQIPLRWLGRALGAAALLLIVTLLQVQVVRADEYVIKPHLGVQADGGRRFQYNPRVLDVARQIPRGSIYDRQGLVLATDDPTVVSKSREEYAKLGVSLGEVCPDLTERCYPLGGRAFHLIGDSRTRLNWAAPNTSYIERDAEDKLRGFDSHAAVVQTLDSSGSLTSATRRDYSALVPLVRHRYQPAHPSVKALLSRPRDLHLTVDARLQRRVASIVSRYASQAPDGRAAAVVIDPDTGALLASASYPWPVRGSSHDSSAPVAENDSEALLDRARYGLYPPGSTFKLVTAAAALRRDIDLSRTTFMCTRLPDGRVGAKIPGWGRPIRDDLRDRHPHGTLDMRHGLVESCNAYFAQLAVRVGPEALRDAAERLGIAVTPSSSIGRLRETLPQAGYGQGDVLATPLRMARVAAAIAANGVVRETQWYASSSQHAASVERPAKADVLLSPDAARLLGSYLRDAVVSGTGRSLRDHPGRIAGKTGTAEVAGSPSHAWFVGFAPYGAATERVAFAVIIEHAGYGGITAAPVAGEIVTAATSIGLVR